MKDLPLEEVSKFALDVSNWVQYKCAVDNEKEFFEPDHIKNFLDDFFNPLYFFKIYYDNSPIPYFYKTRPYESIPYLFSFGRWEKGKIVGEKQTLIDFNNLNGYDEMCEKILTTFPDEGCFVSFENPSNPLAKELRKWSAKKPSHRRKIEHILFNFRDIDFPFMKKNYYLSSFRGSHSESSLITNMFPALVKEQEGLIKEALKDKNKPPMEFRFGKNREVSINNKKYFKDYGRLGLKGIRLLFEELKSKSN